MAAREPSNLKIAADNRRARFDYEIGQTYEDGIALTGTEVKALRTGKATIARARNRVEGRRFIAISLIDVG